MAIVDKINFSVRPTAKMVENPHRGHQEFRSYLVLCISKSYNTLMSFCAHSVYVCNWYHPYAGQDSSIVIIHNLGVL